MMRTLATKIHSQNMVHRVKTHLSSKRTRGHDKGAFNGDDTSLEAMGNELVRQKSNRSDMLSWLAQCLN